MELQKITKEELQDLMIRARAERETISKDVWIMAYDNFILACSILEDYINQKPSYIPKENPLKIGIECGWGQPETDMGGTVEIKCIAPYCDCDKNTGCNESRN